MIARVKGTNDFLDLTLYNFFIDRVRHHLTTYHFTEIATPIIEPLDLFKRALGLYTDVVSKEMFAIQPHPNSTDQICLRPEATASTIRAYLENSIQAAPWQVFSYGPMFRYERPQKGRFRQFHQCNIEIINSENIAADAQCIAMLDRFFSEQLQLSNYVLLINFLGCPADRVKYRETLSAFLKTHYASLCATCQVRAENNVMRVFDCKNESCQALYQDAPSIIDHLCTACGAEWQQLQDLLLMLSISFAYNPKLVRGLDYYNKTVFEFSSAELGAQNAFCGGGRYELASLLGGSKPAPSIGAAIGIERVLLLLEPLRDALRIPQQPALQIIMPMTPAQQPLALLLADTLRASGVCVDVLLGGDSIKAMMRTANKVGAQHALILGEAEQKNGTVMIKNMMTGAQEEIAQIKALEWLKK
jgi:histidyl-tRNA synthetase